MSPRVNAFSAASSQTREGLLEAGLRLLRTEPATSAFGHLTAARVAAEAGRTTGAFFHQWKNIEAYLEDFAAFVLRPELAVNLTNTVTAMGASMQQGRDFTHSLVAASRDIPEQTANDPQAIMELLLWHRAIRDEAFRARIAGLYDQLDQGMSAVYEQLMESLSLEPRPPFTAASIGAMFSGIAQGLALRAALTPGIYSRDIFGWVIATLIPLVARPTGDLRDAGQFVMADAAQPDPTRT